MEIYLYNSLTKTKELFKPIREGLAGMYSCGPTVYFVPHIGNYRSFLLSDLLRRVLSLNGFDVTQVMNITDVGHLTGDRDMGEDKLWQQSVKLGKSMAEIANEATGSFLTELDSLNILPPHHMPKASENVEEDIELIRRLELNGFTYVTADGVYFDTSKLKDYGKMATMDLTGLKMGASVEVNPEKKNPTDFALWKFSDASRGSVWNTPWGIGFPGWHIECSAMSRKYLGQPFDIHTGGIDHINIHHTNEIAQSEAAFGVPLANYWLHGEFLLLGEEKMSKSKGNLFTLQSLVEEGFDPLAFRYLVMTAHYRTQLQFSRESLQAAQKALNNLRVEVSGYSDVILGLDPRIQSDSSWIPDQVGEDKAGGEKTEGSSWIPSQAGNDTGGAGDSFEGRFNEAINDDLNLPKALGVVWEVVGSDLSESDKRQLLLKFDEVLGLGLSSVGLNLSAEEKSLLQLRLNARESKDYLKSDELRQKLLESGIIVEDTAEGQRVKRKYG